MHNNDIQNFDAVLIYQIRWHESWLIVIPCSLALGWCSSLVIFLIGHDLRYTTLKL